MAIDMRDETIADFGDAISELVKENKKLEDENEFLRNRVIELEGKIKDFRKRAVHAEAAVLRMLKWGKKYISEAWDEYDERVERKQAWDEIVAKYTGEFEQ